MKKVEWFVLQRTDYEEEKDRANSNLNNNFIFHWLKCPALAVE